MIKVVIPASGVGARFGAEVPKQFCELDGVPILKHTIEKFDSLDMVDEIVVAVPPGYRQAVIDYGFAKVSHVIEGGASRAHSVYLALQTLTPFMSMGMGTVLIHDGVRPFVSDDIVRAVAAAVEKHGAAVACVPVTDTIKQADENGKIEATPDRSKLWSAQTPQGFTYDIILKSYQQAEKDGMLGLATDDSTLVERMGLPVFVVPSDSENLKITTPHDMVIANAVADRPHLQPALRKVTIYTDGACSGNPGPGGYGVVMICGEGRKELSGGEPQTTNNRMEIMGVIAGLEALKQPCQVDLYSDSRYVVDAIEKGWVTRWQQNNWMRNKKEAALNVDLWERMLPLLDIHNVVFHWVKGHAGQTENERCDVLARQAIAN